MCVQKGFTRNMELLYFKLFLYIFTSGTFWITDFDANRAKLFLYCSTVFVFQ